MTQYEVEMGRTIGTKEVLKLLGLSPSSRDRLIHLRKEHGFPEPVNKFAHKENEYDEKAIVAWIENWDRTLDEEEVCAVTKRSRSALRLWQKKGFFPKPDSRPRRRVVWKISTLKSWAASDVGGYECEGAKAKMRIYLGVSSRQEELAKVEQARAEMRAKKYDRWKERETKKQEEAKQVWGKPLGKTLTEAEICEITGRKSSTLRWWVRTKVFPKPTAKNKKEWAIEALKKWALVKDPSSRRDDARSKMRVFLGLSTQEEENAKRK